MLLDQARWVKCDECRVDCHTRPSVEAATNAVSKCDFCANEMTPDGPRPASPPARTARSISATSTTCGGGCGQVDRYSPLESPPPAGPPSSSNRTGARRPCRDTSRKWPIGKNCRESTPMNESAFSHPDSPVRHSYPLASNTRASGQRCRSCSDAALTDRAVSILLTFSVVTIVWLLAHVRNGSWLGVKLRPIMGSVGSWACSARTLFLVVHRAFGLYLVQAGHIAVLTEFVHRARSRTGRGMFDTAAGRHRALRAGEPVVRMQLLVRGVVGAFNGTLDWVLNLLPIRTLVARRHRRRHRARRDDLHRRKRSSPHRARGDRIRRKVEGCADLLLPEQHGRFSRPPLGWLYWTRC